MLCPHFNLVKHAVKQPSGTLQFPPVPKFITTVYFDQQSKLRIIYAGLNKIINMSYIN